MQGIYKRFCLKVVFCKLQKKHTLKLNIETLSIGLNFIFNSEYSNVCTISCIKYKYNADHAPANKGKT